MDVCISAGVVVIVAVPVIKRTLMVFRVNGVWHVATHRLAVVGWL